MGGMGFRDLKLFNDALLAKQGWRLIHFPNSLVAWVLKAKYYPRCNFLEARVGFCPSYSWRSIWGARHLLEAGMKWRIGDGKSVKIWHDQWIPTPTSFKVVSPVVGLHKDARVYELIDPDTKRWNNGLIDSSFLAHEGQVINSIPLNPHVCSDVLIWSGNSKGLFTVKSAYKIAVSSGDSFCIGSSAVSGDVLFWKNLWKLNIPPKIRIFGWKVCRNLLPTKSNLYHRGVKTDEGCTVCEGAVEYMIHCFSECSVAKSFWKIGAVFFNFNGKDILLLLRDSLMLGDLEGATLIILSLEAMG